MILPALLTLLVVAAGTPPPPDAGPGLDAGVAVVDGGVTEPVDAGYQSWMDGGASGPTLIFRGNKVLPEEVYRAVLQIPPQAPVNRETAIKVRDQLEAFLHHSGYELATINFRLHEGRDIELHIEEGQLEKVVFRGRLTLKTVRFKVALNLPHDIFNRPEVERQLRALPPALGLDTVWYELVATERKNASRPQMESLGPLNEIEGFELLHSQAPYELHIFFAEKDWDTGPGLDVRSGSVDGFELIGNYQGAGLITRVDRYRVAASGGAGMRTRIADQSLYPTFTRATAGGFYEAFTPPVRPLLEVRSELVSRQRPDLHLENYDQLIADGVANVEYDYARRQNVTFGLGVRHLRLFAIDPAPGSTLTPDVYPLAVIRTFAELRANYLFDDGGERFDRRHEISLEARHFFALNDPHYGEAHLVYQRVFAFEWDDLWLRATGAWLWGRVPFASEESMGEHLRNVFGNIYVRKVAGLATEYRLSLTRDIVKLGFFNDVAGFGILDRATGKSDRLAIGDSFGPALHVLAQGMFQIDIYYGVGFTTAVDPVKRAGNPHFNQGISLSLNKVF
jgi:hypothetical protein